MGGGDGFLRRPLRLFDGAHFFRRLHHTLLIERIRFRFEAVAPLLQPSGMDDREIRRHRQASDLSLFQDYMDDIDGCRRFNALFLRLLFDF